jgi:DNA-binding NarL/FixJ family response regulator
MSVVLGGREKGLGKMPNIRVVLVEDDDRTRTRLGRVISRHATRELVASVGNCAEARKSLAAHRPDLLVTDLGLPDGTGLDLIRLTHRSLPNCRIMVITVFGDESHVIEALAAGANGYLLKDGTCEEIDEALLALVDGGAPMSASIARHLLTRFRVYDAGANVDDAKAPEVRLTERESEVLRLLAKGFSYVEIAGQLGISRHTVTTYGRRMYEKLEVTSRGEAVYEAVHLGLLRMDD